MKGQKGAFFLQYKYRHIINRDIYINRDVLTHEFFQRFKNKTSNTIIEMEN